MTGYTLIPLTAQWTAEVERIEQLCFTDPWTRGGIEHDILGACSFWYGMEDDRTGRLAAFLGAHVIGDEGEIVSLATDPACRRRGLAEALIRALADAHPALTRIFLEVRASNTAAQALYEKLGFVRYGVRRGYYERPTEDAVLMRRLGKRGETC